jgi:hypothetical protein
VGVLSCPATVLALLHGSIVRLFPVLGMDCVASAVDAIAAGGGFIREEQKQRTGVFEGEDSARRYDESGRTE